MSEVENNQQTNGTSNGDVPEIELIIKEEFMLVNEFLDNTNDNNINNISVGELYNYIDEKENIVETNELLKPKLQQQQNMKEYRLTNIEENYLAPRKDHLVQNQQNVATATITPKDHHILTLTHFDSQHFHFDFVSPKKCETATITDLTPSMHLQPQQNLLCSNSTIGTINENASINQANNVSLFDVPITEEVANKDAYTIPNNPDGSLNFAAMVAEACEGLFDEIEKDLRSCETDGDNNSCQDIESTESTSDTSICSATTTASSKRRKKRSHNSDAVKLATNAVVVGGMSLGEAAKRFSVVRSTVSSRVVKHPKYKRRKQNKELDELIRSKIKAGLQISEIARSLHVPKSTVHLHKTRLKNSGELPPIWIRCGNKDIVDHGVQDRLIQAYRGHIVNGMSVRFAAEFYSLPITTLWRYIKRRKSLAATNSTVDDFSNKSALDESANHAIDNNVLNAEQFFKDLNIAGTANNKEGNLECASVAWSTDLVNLTEKEEEIIEQTLINALLE
ncbi:uncharacterized protein Clic isoform X2 [Eurosta solidaginis]|uniref:uncharacterized protein Clic isoform X2 n=1 Tax=Eurosta solidaginis TaxID=178769 RepID=UPI00353149A7